MKNFIAISMCSSDQLQDLLNLSSKLKAMYKSGGSDNSLAGKNLVMIFEKPSLRTRMSFQVAMTDLGGKTIYVRPQDIGGMVGKREPVKDMARVLDRYVDAIMARTFSHDTIINLAEYASVPVINALTDFCHPCQAMADVLTIKEHFSSLKGIKIAYIGDGNNVARSLAFACAKFQMQLVVASPQGYELDSESIVKANQMLDGCVSQITDPRQAVSDADVVYTDTWTSMGQEDEKQKRINDFTGYQVNMDLLKAASKNPKIMHCLPAYRGLEISDQATESPNSIIFDQAENRLHFQRALLYKLIGKEND